MKSPAINAYASRDRADQSKMGKTPPDDPVDNIAQPLLAEALTLCEELQKVESSNFRISASSVV